MNLNPARYTSVILIVLLFSIFPVAFSQINKRDVKQDWDTDTSQAVISLDELWILLKRDGIPPIEEPDYLNQEEAVEIFFENEPVISIDFGNDPKAYPLSILTYHEIVNDNSRDTWFTISYCPLCNSSVVFNRDLEFEGNTYRLDFGTSGMLRKSNLVMWDRQTESWWQQITGEGLSGKLAGAKLEMLPSQIVSVEEFFMENPDGKMLSTKTGYKKKYGKNPYEDYDNPGNTKPRLFGDDVDKRLQPMERVIHIFGSETPKIYPLSRLRMEKVINDRHQGTEVVIFYQDGAVSVLDKSEIRESKSIGSVTVFHPYINEQKLTFKSTASNFKDKETGSTWTLGGRCIKGKLEGSQLLPVVYGNHFAFAWLAFYPETVIYGQ